MSTVTESTTAEAGLSTSPAPAGRSLAVIRIGLGWILLWTFLDASLSLGFPTGRAADGSIDYLGDEAWINGGSPTAMLETMANGPFAGFFRDIGGDVWLDWLFMSELALSTPSGPVFDGL